MGKLFLSFLACGIIGSGIFFSCQKEISCEGCATNTSQSGTNKPPLAIAGPDQVITLPTDSVSLDGSASSDSDGKISEWRWQKISGPASFAISSSTTAKTIVKNLAVGTYLFELMVTDDGGLSARDTVAVRLDSIPGSNQPVNHPPIADAGADQSIILPTNSTTLDGSGSTDPDNDITSYFWTKIAGPSSFSITNPNDKQTPVTNLVAGIYDFELKVSDATGLFSKDTMHLAVVSQSAPPAECNNNNRPLINAELVPIGTISQARGQMSVASAGNKILFAGGVGIGQQGESSRVDIFDVAANTWSTAELSVARVWTAAIAAGNKIFLAGGQINGDSYDGVDIYDASTNTWTLSHLSRQADALATATAGNKVLFAGGNWGIYATNVVDMYDLTTNVWSTASLSVPMNFITAVSANNKVYFSGGDPWNGQMSNVIDIYDAASSTWSTSTLQVSRGYHAAIAVNDILYFAGGSTLGYGSSPTCSVETLNTNTGARTLMNLFSPASCFVDAGQNAVAKDNKIILLRQDGGVNANKFDIYDVQANSWSIGVLPQPVPKDASVISVNNTIYVAGGYVNGVLTNQVWKLEF